MAQTMDDDLARIEEAISLFHQAMSRPRSWEMIALRAGISVDRSGAAMLKMLSGGDGPDCHLQDLADRLGIEAPSVTRKVQQLEQAGLVKRQADPSDRRASVVTATAAGQRVVAKLHDARRAQIAEILQDWPENDRHQFAELFSRLAHDIAAQTMVSHHKQNS